MGAKTAEVEVIRKSVEKRQRQLEEVSHQVEQELASKRRSLKVDGH